MRPLWIPSNYPHFSLTYFNPAVLFYVKYEILLQNIKFLKCWCLFKIMLWKDLMRGRYSSMMKGKFLWKYSWIVQNSEFRCKNDQINIIFGFISFQHWILKQKDKAHLKSEIECQSVSCCCPSPKSGRPGFNNERWGKTHTD